MIQAKPEIIIRSDKTVKQYWRDVYLYRELFFFLAWRDILVRYKQTTIGIAWSVIRPIVTMAIFTLVFGVMAKLPSHGLPYPMMVFSAMLPWQFISTAISESSNSLVENAGILSKVYFPRLIIPISAIIVGFVEFLISVCIFIGLMVWYHISPSGNIFLLPYFITMATAAAIGSGLWLSALNVKYRDFRYTIPFILHVSLYISPVGFTSDLIPEKWKTIYFINPIAGIIDGFRWSLLGVGNIYMRGMIVSCISTLVLVVLGLRYFKKVERSLADII